MATDPELLKLLIETFTVELEEQTQVMTDGLLALENTSPGDAAYKENIDSLFRAAHNIKGAARGIGINNVGSISHELENIFSSIKKKERSVDSFLIDLTLESIDKMRASMQAYVANKPVDFDVDAFLAKLSNSIAHPTPIKEITKDPEQIQTKEPEEVETAKNKDTIRVSIDNIDHVSALMEEIQINKISISDHYNSLIRLTEKIQQLIDYWKRNKIQPEDTLNDEKHLKFNHHIEDEISGLGHLSNHLQQQFHVNVNDLSILANSLQDEVSRLRLIPASHLLQTLPRQVRNLARDLGKDVHLVLKGEDVRMDKLILEGLQDPLTHLLRNSIDHGVLSPAQRKALGKPEAGELTIEIIDEGDQILIIFKDDGKGIDPDKIAKTAISKNIISQAEISAMSEDEIIQLIFRPGFSTSEIITNISGRGVGLDVVKSNLAALKGSVSVETVNGSGTTFYLRVPLTLTSERGLLVKCGNDNFVVPTSSILRVDNIPYSAVKSVEGQDIIIEDNHPIILHTLADILDLPKHEISNTVSMPVVILKKDWYMLALIVDEIYGEREIVVKPLQPPLKALDCIAGGTLSSTGQVIIVLNVGDIIHKGLNQHFGTVLSNSAKNVTVKEPLHILVVDDSITTRTLEQNILESRGYKVTVAVNGKDAWELLQTIQVSMVITDVNMPLMDGFELTTRIKQSEKLRALPVIIVTSQDSDHEKRLGIEAGADAYIIKNEFESNKLLQTIVQLES